MPSVESVHERLGAFDHGVVVEVATRPVRPVACVHVLAEVDAAITHVPEHLRQGHSLLSHEVAPVIDEDVQGFREVGFEFGPERWVALVSNDDSHTFLLELLALCINVHADIAVVGVVGWSRVCETQCI